MVAYLNTVFPSLLPWIVKFVKVFIKKQASPRNGAVVADFKVMQDEKGGSSGHVAMAEVRGGILTDIKIAALAQ